MEADTAPAGFVKRAAVAAGLLLVVSRLLALDGDVRMHNPSTIIQADGRFYVYGAGKRECPDVVEVSGRATGSHIDCRPNAIDVAHCCWPCRTDALIGSDHIRTRRPEHLGSVRPKSREVPATDALDFRLRIVRTSDAQTHTRRERRDNGGPLHRFRPFGPAPSRLDHR
jgi:hypothetical protein